MAAFALSRAAGAQPTQSARPQGLVRGPARQFTSSRNVQAAFWGRKKKAPEPAPEVPGERCLEAWGGSQSSGKRCRAREAGRPQ